MSTGEALRIHILDQLTDAQHDETCNVVLHPDTEIDCDCLLGRIHALVDTAEAAARRPSDVILKAGMSTDAAARFVEQFNQVAKSGRGVQYLPPDRPARRRLRLPKFLRRKPKPVSVRGFCSKQHWCRLSDGHASLCQP